LSNNQSTDVKNLRDDLYYIFLINFSPKICIEVFDLGRFIFFKSREIQWKNCSNRGWPYVQWAKSVWRHA